jgi:hypothetical protein
MPVVRACILLLLLLVAPLAAAAPPEARLSARLQVAVPIQDLEVRAASPAVASVQACTGDPAHYRADPATRTFSFAEPAQGAGCLGVRYALDLPAGTTRFNVTFLANRSVDQGQFPLGPPTMRQELRLFGDGLRLGGVEIYRPDRLTQPLYGFSPGFDDLPQRPTRLELEWWFEDAGREGTGGPSRLEAFAATVVDPQVTIDDLPLGEVPVQLAGRSVQGGTRESTYTVQASVPPQMIAAAADGRVALRLTLAGDLTLTVAKVTGPGGDPVDFQASTVDSGSRRTVRIEIPAAVLAAGAGTYLVQVGAAEAVEPRPEYQWFAATFLLLPLLASAIAWVGLGRHRAEEET